ncbi:hypothetical protein G4G28_13995 [Massilia sp. Dwa41.01b]|uniref:hypothetical protein n=1 Tax=unclassified Massilia TaxID=2609279 RepID=UPI0016005B30|nr:MULTISPECIES: hypothetical protein [unclassified Massilia]QNA89299.1 hypothetical protein G4G28_13995 [Massilia sp. Dwa41.01b]QNB00201.1 hypothetical protein G4G31_17575 [Massilia sp. Se16.2.3]
MNPVLHVESDPHDLTMLNIIECIKSIQCEDHFASREKRTQRERASVVKGFQQAVVHELETNLAEEFVWSQEYKHPSDRKDAVDIFGTSRDALVVIELDANRADQVAKKFLSRSAIFEGNKIYYISLCYPGTEYMSVKECIKYFDYCANLARRLGNVYAGLLIQRI